MIRTEKPLNSFASTTSSVPFHSPSLLLNCLDASQWRGIFRGDVAQCQIKTTLALCGERTARDQPCVTGVICGNNDCDFCPNSCLSGCKLSRHVQERFTDWPRWTVVYIFNHTKMEHLTCKNGLLIGPFSCQKNVHVNIFLLRAVQAKKNKITK